MARRNQKISNERMERTRKIIKMIYIYNEIINTIKNRARETHTRTMIDTQEQAAKASLLPSGHSFSKIATCKAIRKGAQPPSGGLNN